MDSHRFLESLSTEFSLSPISLSRSSPPPYPFTIKSYSFGSIVSQRILQRQPHVRKFCSAMTTSRLGISSDRNAHEFVVEDDIRALLKILPHDLQNNILHEPKHSQLVEVILDLGRLPVAYYLDDAGRQYLRNTEVSMKELEQIQEEVGEFGGDNRAGISGTLHRISAIRSREGKLIGLTMRVGRVLRGHVDMVMDLLDFGESILFVGRPGVGKTTIMREISRVLSDELRKRVVIVDTSNEMGGCGDILHPAVGSARRMHVLDHSMQHHVMIEAVENHMPEVVIVDEIGTYASVQTCHTIAERGVMLIGTAHGERLENVLKDPILSNLVGGLKTATLADKEASARNCNKSILERKASPTFPFLIEIRDRDYWVTHRTEKSVDSLLRGEKPFIEVRKRDKDSKVIIERWRTDD